MEQPGHYPWNGLRLTSVPSGPAIREPVSGRPPGSTFLRAETAGQSRGGDRVPHVRDPQRRNGHRLSNGKDEASPRYGEARRNQTLDPGVLVHSFGCPRARLKSASAIKRPCRHRRVVGAGGGALEGGRTSKIHRLADTDPLHGRPPALAGTAETVRKRAWNERALLPTLLPRQISGEVRGEV